MSSHPVSAPPWTLAAMRFAERLVTLRKQKGLTQQALSDLTGIHLTQIRRYEGGATQPTFEMLRKLAVALSVSADVLLFDEGERGPGDDLRLQFEAAQRLDPDEREVVKTLIEGILLQARSQALGPLRVAGYRALVTHKQAAQSGAVVHRPVCQRRFLPRMALRDNVLSNRVEACTELVNVPAGNGDPQQCSSVGSLHHEARGALPHSRYVVSRPGPSAA